ncbi:MAG: LuxR C-terminal-related transcriptional regulator, partial [Bradymonadaceae bacterium]
FELTDGVEGQPSMVSHLWDPFAPAPDEKDRFVRIEYEPKRLVDDADGWVLREFYGSRHIPCQTRALLYEDERLMRRRPEPFDEEDVETLDRMVPSLKSALSVADRMEKETLEGPADLLFEPKGPSIEYASSEAREWLTAERIEVLEDVLRRAGRGEGFPSTLIFEGRRFRVARLDGALGGRYSLTIEPVERPELSPKAALTPRQREVAEFAAVGATADEIAETLNVSPNTVRDHIRRIYRRLGIGSRAELARKIEVD